MRCSKFQIWVLGHQKIIRLHLTTNASVKVINYEGSEGADSEHLTIVYIILKLFLLLRWAKTSHSGVSSLWCCGDQTKMTRKQEGNEIKGSCTHYGYEWIIPNTVSKLWVESELSGCYYRPVIAAGSAGTQCIVPLWRCVLSSFFCNKLRPTYYLLSWMH